MTKQNKLTEEATKEKRRMETWQKIGQLTGSQARIALVGILEGKPLSEAIKLAKTYPT